MVDLRIPVDVIEEAIDGKSLWYIWVFLWCRHLVEAYTAHVADGCHEQQGEDQGTGPGEGTGLT